jgi:hypothetical protein
VALGRYDRPHLPPGNRRYGNSLGLGLHQKYTDLLKEIAQGYGITLYCDCGQRGDFAGVDALTGAYEFMRSHLQHRMTIERWT